MVCKVANLVWDSFFTEPYQKYTLCTPRCIAELVYGLIQPIWTHHYFNYFYNGRVITGCAIKKEKEELNPLCGISS